jgi:hypothetical protein
VALIVAVSATYHCIVDNFDEARKGAELGIFSIGGKMARHRWWPGHCQQSDVVQADANPETGCLI